MDARRLVLVGAIVGAVGLGFLGAGGWLSPHALTPSRFIDTFETANGEHPGFRRNHAKGVVVHGFFQANGNGVRLSKAVVFTKGAVPVTGRFALAGGMPYAIDTLANVRSMALRFELANGEEWRTGMNDIPVFVVRTPEGFRDQLIANAPDPQTGKPDPKKQQSFFAAHPESVEAIKHLEARAPTAGFAESSYRSLNAFLFVDASGTARAVRWAMVPSPSTTTDDSDAGAVAHQGNAKSAPGPNFLFDTLIARIHERPLTWHLIVTLAGPGDPTNDATLPWPSDRETVDVGTLTIDRIESEEGSLARTLNFDPLVLPDGIRASDDPLLSARSAAYSESARRRLGEPAPSSAVRPAEVSP